MQEGNQLAGGRYVLERCIKRTGMAEVWQASQRGGGGFSKPVVVKMIHPDLNEQREAQKRFLDEAHVASQIQHAHVVQVFDFGEQDGLHYLVMEYIEGPDIDAIIERAQALKQPLPLPIVCRLMADACQGLGFIHDITDANGQPLELVHRDISPQNLVVANSGALKIIDFGIVKARQKESRTRTGVIVGKLQYMSPEQLSSEELDRRADIYALGLVLYEMLTLRPRFRGSNMLEVFYEALNEPPPIVVDHRPDCPPELVRCVQTALAQEKEHRYPTAYAMQEALESYLISTGNSISQRQISEFLQLHFGEPQAHIPDATARYNPASMMAHNPPPVHEPEATSVTPRNYNLDDEYTFSGMVSQNYSEDAPLGEEHTLGAQPLYSPMMDDSYNPFEDANDPYADSQQSNHEATVLVSFPKEDEERYLGSSDTVVYAAQTTQQDGMYPPHAGFHPSAHALDDSAPTEAFRPAPPRPQRQQPAPPHAPPPNSFTNHPFFLPATIGAGIGIILAAIMITYFVLR